MRRHILLLIPLLALLLGCQTSPSTSSSDTEGLFDEIWQHRLERNRQMSVWYGGKDDGSIASVSPDALEEERAYLQEFRDRLAALDASQLSEEDQVNVAILDRQLWDTLEGIRFGAHEIPFLSDSGFWVWLSWLPRESRLESKEDFENYIKRLEAFPQHFSEHVDNMRGGLGRGMTMPCVILSDTFFSSIRGPIVDDVEQSLFYKPFETFPETIGSGTAVELERRGRDAISGAVIPAYRTLLDFMQTEYKAGCRRTLGAHQLPDGEAYYAQRIKYYTTLDMTAQEVHELGKSEVARIRAEMMEIIERVGFEGSFDDFLRYLRTDPRFYATTPQQLLERAAHISKTMDGKLPSLIKTLPRLPYTVEPVPDHIAPNYTAGRYVGPQEGSTDPGIYWVNTYKLESRPLYSLTALTLHEAVPGHHLQRGLALEQAEQPAFRRTEYISAYGEGWGLYSEWLGLEAGMYEDPYDDFGRLTYEMWRACRLVVDTGLHAFGWSREQAVDYMASNTALSLHEVNTETDRYISWPGQALSYKIGELKIKELRKTAADTLGERFDKRSFHDVILAQGSVPLPVLEDAVMRWVEAERARNAS